MPLQSELIARTNFYIDETMQKEWKTKKFFKKVSPDLAANDVQR